MSQPDALVLIVGAGPAGLALAIEAQRRGIRHRIIDRLPAPIDDSRATDLQPRSLEILARTGVLPQIIARGARVHAINIHSGPRPIARMTFAGLDTRYPYMMASAQRDTESALTARYLHLGGSIERGIELVDLASDADSAVVRLRRGEGEEILRCAWVIGCDGAHSRVRHLIGADFPGITYPEHYMRADARMTWDIAKDELHGFLTPTGYLLVLALPGADEYRLFVDIDPSDERQPSLELFREFVAARSPIPAVLHRVERAVRFRQHRRQVPQYCVGRAILVGDAAHVHSIIPGQGLNLALQDAYNLGWKLALVCHGLADEALLRSYHAERHPIGRLTLSMTDAFHRVLVLRAPLARRIRDALFPRLMALPAVHDHATALSAELSHSYRGSPIIRRAPRHLLTSRAAPRPGERAPDLRLSGDLWLSDLLSDLRHEVLFFTGPRTDAPSVRAEYTRLHADLSAHTHAPFGMHLVSLDPAGSGLIPDVGGALHRRYGLPRGGLVVIRPDGYIAFRSHDRRPTALLELLLGRSGLTPPTPLSRPSASASERATGC
jgi:2-polyprenyl-6-methoxyphenol hydroxylase-like FAD-dependent oxidoreductase